MALDKFFDAPSATDELEEQKKQFIDHMNVLKTMSVEEQTLYKKWYELSTQYTGWYNKAGILCANVWRPSNITNVNETIKEIEQLQPVLEVVNPSDKKGIEDWTVYRVFVSSFNFDQNPGRFLRFFLKDAVTGKILGITSLGSDVMNIGVRDQYIGWTDEQKESGMLKHTAIGTTIVSMQPFGYNFLGGKLLAALLTEPTIRNAWKSAYGDELVGITTTSLYGGGSMYNSIPWWKSLGHTAGKVPIKPDEHLYKIWHDIIKKNYPELHAEWLVNDGSGPSTGVKGKILNLIFKEVGIKPSEYVHGFERGVYFAPLYENTNQFLKQEITVDKLIPKKRGTDYQTIMNWWRPKAIARYQTLAAENRLKAGVLFYHRMMFLDWETAKQQYLMDVGR